MIRKFFAPPVFDNDEDNFRAKFINGFAWAATANLIIYLIIDLATASFSTTRIAVIALIVVSFFSIFILRTGNINASGSVIVALGWAGITYQAYYAAGVKDVILFAYIAVALLASIVINQLIGGLVILASITAIWTLALLETKDFLTLRFQTATEYAVSLTLVLIAISILIYYSSTGIRDAITRANKSEAGLKKSNKELLELNQTLEDRVNNRTAELELANQRIQKRAKQFEAIAVVARATTTNESLETLLPKLASLVSEQFDFYHTGIFLLDENRKYAVLSAANSLGGKRMLERGHKL
ncbi:MAG TPA: hypothetical protein DCX53_06105, partial [Anaerolineae bacterium]|nr:hypothetical protein [Anaerolineae bacterium]